MEICNEIQGSNSAFLQRQSQVLVRNLTSIRQPVQVKEFNSFILSRLIEESSVDMAKWHGSLIPANVLFLGCSLLNNKLKCGAHFRWSILWMFSSTRRKGSSLVCCLGHLSSAAHRSWPSYQRPAWSGGSASWSIWFWSTLVDLVLVPVQGTSTSYVRRPITLHLAALKCTTNNSLVSVMMVIF
jgi:hypothetical protein